MGANAGTDLVANHSVDVGSMVWHCFVTVVGFQLHIAVAALRGTWTEPDPGLPVLLGPSTLHSSWMLRWISLIALVVFSGARGVPPRQVS